jgi:hypothetical protein
MTLSVLLAGATPATAPARRRLSVAALVALAVLSCVSGLAAAPGRSRAVPFGVVEVSARRAPTTFGLLPISRRDDAVLRSQPELQSVGVSTTLARARLARLQGDRIRRLNGSTGRRRLGFDGDTPGGRRSGAAAPRLRAPPSPD